MRARTMITLVAGVTMGALTLVGGTVAAADYPPSDPGLTTVAVGGAPSTGAEQTPPAATSTSDLADTGSDNGVLIKVAAGSLVAGAGLVVVAKQRRTVAAV